MLRRLWFALIVLGIAFSRSLCAQCPITPTTIFYQNGILTTGSQADDDRKLLEMRLREFLAPKYGNLPAGCLTTELAHVPTGGALADLIGALNQVCDAGQPPLSTRVQWLLSVLGLDKYPNNNPCYTSTAFDRLRNQFTVSSLSADEINLISLYVAIFKHQIGDLNRDVVVVSHSRGNLFANSEYNASGIGVEDRKRIHLVAVATPSDYVAGYSHGSEKYVTLAEDVVASSVFPPSHLAANSHNPSCLQVLTAPEFFCHLFVPSYLDNYDSRVLMLLYITSLIRQAPAVGTVGVQAILDGFTWPPAGSGAVNYTLSCAGQPVSGTGVPKTFSNEPVGPCTIAGISGGPPNSTLSAVSPAFSQTLGAGQMLTFTLQFKSNPPTAGFTMTSGSQSATDGQTLSLTANSDPVSVNFDGAKRSGAVNGGSVIGWSWSINGTPRASTAAFVYSFQPGTYIVSLTVTDNRGALSSAVQSTIIVTGNTNHQFVPTGSMSAPRFVHAASILQNGKVLVTGGDSTGQIRLASAELYDPTSGTFSDTGSMNTARDFHTATLLPNGKVLIAGGADNLGHKLSTAELYDPSTGTFTFSAGTMRLARAGHTATLLLTGKVLLVGGDPIITGDAAEGTKAELYDPSTDSFSLSGSMAVARGAPSFAATLLPSGNVLITGGFGSPPTSPSYASITSAEIYNPNTGTFSFAGNMTVSREYHSATLLSNGKVLIAGGAIIPFGPGTFYLASAELYDPTSGTFSATASMATARASHTATLLKDGTVLLAGGDTFCGSNGTGCAVATPTAEIFDPASSTFNPTASMSVARDRMTATLLSTGGVLVAGGANSQGLLSIAELFLP